MDGKLLKGKKKGTDKGLQPSCSDLRQGKNGLKLVVKH